jgi:uncharacterized membrane protein
MKALFWIGLVVLILGIVSAAVPIPHGSREGVTVGGVSLGVETRTEDVAPVVSAALIAGGLIALIAGTRKSV